MLWHTTMQTFTHQTYCRADAAVGSGCSAGGSRSMLTHLPTYTYTYTQAHTRTQTPLGESESERTDRPKFLIILPWLKMNALTHTFTCTCTHTRAHSLSHAHRQKRITLACSRVYALGTPYDLVSDGLLQCRHIMIHRAPLRSARKRTLWVRTHFSHSRWTIVRVRVCVSVCAPQPLPLLTESVPRRLTCVFIMLD